MDPEQGSLPPRLQFRRRRKGPIKKKATRQSRRRSRSHLLPFRTPATRENGFSWRKSASLQGLRDTALPCLWKASAPHPTYPKNSQFSGFALVTFTITPHRTGSGAKGRHFTSGAQLPTCAPSLNNTVMTNTRSTSSLVYESDGNRERLEAGSRAVETCSHLFPDDDRCRIPRFRLFNSYGRRFKLRSGELPTLLARRGDVATSETRRVVTRGNTDILMGFDSRWGSSRIFARGNRAGRCRWSAGFLGNLPFLPPLHSGAAPYLPHFTLIGSQDPDVDLKSVSLYREHPLPQVTGNKDVGNLRLGSAIRGTQLSFSDSFEDG
ncbi:hypothetical protein PR048_006388 [Dryococelus australis]|uniref:Uncharacterized protein n=1 Tax=Dryococelus australis TaxID=614101 RepID=A0ABQ9IAV5_9NEOP|nr:hypothetical protein PR048_006388 [Dryococelus australis]